MRLWPAPLLLAACAASAPAPDRAGAAALEVRSADMPFTLSDGAAAKRMADQTCGPGGVRTSIYDRFDAASAAWVFVEGCA